MTAVELATLEENIAGVTLNRPERLNAIDGSLIDAMDKAGVDVGVLTGGLSGSNIEEYLEIADDFPGRLVVAGTVDRAERPVKMAARVRELAQHDRLAAGG